MPTTNPAIVDLSTIASFVQIAFWIVAGTVAVLTYRHARRALFQPVRTELLKLQLAEIVKVIRLFEDISERHLVLAVDAHGLVQVNATFMFDQYRQVAFGITVEPDTREYSREKCPRVVLFGGEWHKERVIGGVLFTSDVNAAGATEALTPPATWAEYDASLIHMTSQFSLYYAEVFALCHNPMIPSVCRTALSKYFLQISHMLELLRKALIDAAKEMPARYPSEGHFDGTTAAWVRTKFFASLVDSPFQPAAREVTSAIRDYYGTADLLDLRK